MKKMISILTVAIMGIVILLPVNVMAAENPNQENEIRNVELSVDGDEYGIEPQTDGYYYWEIESKTNQGTVYGAWKLGLEGDGPGTITLDKTDTVTNTITGSYTSASVIGASLGVTIGKSQSHAVHYSLPVPAGKTYQIKYRPLFHKELKQGAKAPCFMWCTCSG